MYILNSCIFLIGSKTKKKRSTSQYDSDSQSSSSALSSSAIQHYIDVLKQDCIRSGTKKVYYSVWIQFNHFIIRLDHKPKTWEDRLMLFVGHLVKTEKKSTTIASYISAIKAVLKSDGGYMNQDKCLLNSLTKACRLKILSSESNCPFKRAY